jgi:hypothetical protein
MCARATDGMIGVLKNPLFHLFAMIQLLRSA